VNFKFRSTIRIGSREVGLSHPVFVIAEIGVNHNGDIELAREMVRSAAECGVDCVKFQTFRAEEFMATRGVEYCYNSAGRAVTEDMYDMFSRLELPASWHVQLFDYARELGLIPLTSVADPLSAKVAEEAGSVAYKLASEDLINLPLLKHMATMGRPLLLSTGMADEQEIDDAIKILQNNNLDRVLFFHCVSVYPTPDDEVRLGRMLALSKKIGTPVGYSDHSLGITASIAAVALGACAIEKHFTTDRNLEGPDQALSSNPEEMKELVDEIRRVERMRGAIKSETLSPSPTEMKLRGSFRRSLVAANDLPAGTEISQGDLLLQRAGIEGIRYRDKEQLLGKKLRSTVLKGRPIMPSDLT